jgi:methionyl-tRNA formyltransferase
MEEKAKAGSRVKDASELPSLIFLGTPEFAVPSLRKLVAAGADILLVITQPDRFRGRGKKVTPSPIKAVAESLGIPVYQPERIRAEQAIQQIAAHQAQCLVVVAYGQLLPQGLLEKPPCGTINVHASLLPRYRGAAPIQRALLEGEKITGISIMLLDAGMDTGPILQQQTFAVSDQETFGSVHDKLASSGADLLLETLALWKAGDVAAIAQEEHLATYAPPIRKSELQLPWHEAAEHLVNRIRAFDPWPGAHCHYQGKRLKCFAATLLPWKGSGQGGEILGVAQEGLVVHAGDQRMIAIGALQMEGHRRLSAGDFVRGHPMARHSHLE